MANGKTSLLAEMITSTTFRKFGVESVSLKSDSYVVDVSTVKMSDDKVRTFVEGWLCFDTEHDFILYLNHVCFPFIETYKYKRCDHITKQVVGYLKKALLLAVRERGFKKAALQDMIISSIGDLGGIRFDNLGYVNDDDFTKTLAWFCLDSRGKHGKLASVVNSMKFNAKNPEHLKLMQAWMIECPDGWVES